MVAPDRAALVKAQALIGDAYDDLSGALVLYRTDDQRRYHEYLHDMRKELDAAAKALGATINWPLPPEVSALAQACQDILVQEAGFEIVGRVSIEELEQSDVR